MRSSIVLSLLAAAICAAAFESFNADSELERRFPYAGGGWGLRTNSCPAGTFVVDGGGGYQRCCPNGMVAPDVGLFCCVGGKLCLLSEDPNIPRILIRIIETTCGEALSAIPFCADSNWMLWNATGTLFCCLPGQIGTMSALCVSGTTAVAATLSAALVGLL